MRPTIAITDCSVDPHNAVVREMNDEEYAEHLARLEKYEQEKLAEESTND